jgi:preprotein translocase subunit SecA
MFQRILNSIAGDYNQRQINKLLPYIKTINDFDAQWDSLSDEQIKAKTPEFVARFAAGETLDALLPEAFATVKQACKRMRGQEFPVKWQMVMWDMVPYDVQLLWWMILHYGKIAEMKTGEWKTLVATLPIYLNALSKKWAHLVTVNDYLATRDSEWMSHLYWWLGLTTWSVTKAVAPHLRRAEYEKDITYVENSELGFDYLRDNLVRSNAERQLLRRPLNFAIVDEVDSILIDEARTPLIISYPSDEPTEKYAYYSTIVRQLKPCSNKKKVSKWLLGDMMNPQDVVEEDGDYYIDEKNKNVSLSWMGIGKLEKIIWVENLYQDLGFDEIHHIENALKSWAVFQNNKDYIVQDGEILIVDEHTGRTMPGRRYSEWLHQAIEAKESVQIQKESKTMATITYQNFFKLYDKLCGMTGTATTEWEEFEKIYSLEVLSVPTNKPTIRVDQNDKVFFNQNAKWQAVVDYIRFYHDAGIPILIGTSSIHTSEYVSDILRKLAIQHYVLNAKFHQQEAEIIANAGKHKSVVVATNMAWRGTDIKLEKWLHEKVWVWYAKRAQYAIKWDTFAKKDPQSVSYTVYSGQEYDTTLEWMKTVFGITDEQIRQATWQWVQTDTCRFKITLNTAKKKPDINWPIAEIMIAPVGIEKPEVTYRDLHYGLFILGTEKHESRRIDNQLRGRAWRQWDPGSSVFFVALDDEIMRKMWGEKIQSVAKMLLPKDQLEQLELTQSQFTNSIIRAQKQMEWWNFSIRKHLFDYDSVISRQRQRIYTKRDEMLAQELLDETTIQDGMTPTIREVQWFIPAVVDWLLAKYQSLDADTDTIVTTMQQEFGVHIPAYTWPQKWQWLRTYLIEQVEKMFDEHVKSWDIRLVDATTRMIYLSTIDKYWVDHIDAMSYLRDKVWLYWYAQQDPLIMYKQEAFSKFQQLLETIKLESLAVLMRSDFSTLWNNQIQLQEQNYEKNVLDKLQEAASSAPAYNPQTAPQSSWVSPDMSGSRFARAFSTDDVEVFHTGTRDQGLGTSLKQYNRNDLVVLVWPNGEEKEMKYKKAEELLGKGWRIK